MVKGRCVGVLHLFWIGGDGFGSTARGRAGWILCLCILAWLLAGKQRITEAKFHPGYVFVEMRLEADGCIPQVKMQFAAGDAVTIREGPFQNYQGTVGSTVPVKDVVGVLVTILGRQMPVDVGYRQVAKAGGGGGLETPPDIRVP
jgi:hypothetical protein